MMAHLVPAMLFLTVGFQSVCSFNLETVNPKSFAQDPQSQFGYRVTQVNGGQNWMLVSSPRMKDSNQNETGAIYQCRYSDSTCSKINTPFPPGAKNMGLSLATGVSNGEPKVLACVPRFSYECYTNTYINGYCDVLPSSLRSRERIPAKLPECPRVLIDIAFLIDGSGSVYREDFNKMKEFIKVIMKKFRNKDTQIALAQFSSHPRTEFTFTQYNQASNKEYLVDKIQQIQSGTRTPTGMNYVVDHIFTQSAGGRNDAKRIMITITDGQSFETDFSGAIRAANQKKIERYSIGVGNAFTSDKAKRELEMIASKKKNVFRVDNFNALDTIQKELQEKIFAIEGTSGSGALSSFQLEMAQEGFSALISNEAFLLGAVGAYDWSGGLVEYKAGVRKFINLTATMNPDVKNAYLGYTVKEARKDNQRFYVTGAPRYGHKGHVFIFSTGTRRALSDQVNGEQIGSYFGSELCPVDLDRDGQTDLLLVAAPMYHSQQNGGIVYVYRMESRGTVRRVSFLLGVRGEAFGRFGTAIAEVTDLNGDGLTDVAIGAPLEDAHQGAVYIYHGAQDRIKPTHSQVTSPSMNLTYQLELDPGRKIDRAELKTNAIGSFVLTGKHCLTPEIEVKSCIMDFLNPIEVQVKYTGVGQSSGNNPAPILHSGQNGIYAGKLPFEKACGDDNICKDHLVVLFNIVGAQFIVVGSYSTLTLEVTLENTDENSYFTKVIYQVPTGLTFRKTTIISASRRSRIECDDSKNSKYSAVGIVSCRVNHPIFRTGTRMRFNTTFDVASDVVWQREAKISINATSDNEQRITVDSLVSKTIGVKYEINVIIKGIESTQYINFTTMAAGDKVVLHAYKVENVGPQSLPVNITFSVPFKIGTGLTWEKLVVNTTDQEAKCNEMTTIPQVSRQQMDTFNSSQGCMVSTCLMYVCQMPQLKHNGRTTFSISGVVSWSKPNQANPQDVKLTTYAKVGYDENKYIHVSQATNRFQEAKVTTRVEIVKEVNQLPIIIGSTIGGLALLAIVAGVLYKVGFFKRGYKAKLEDAGDEGSGGVTTDASTPSTNAATA
ncbi:integrin alpha-M-like [Scyliorhinus torazame]